MSRCLCAVNTCFVAGSLAGNLTDADANASRRKRRRRVSQTRRRTTGATSSETRPGGALHGHHLLAATVKWIYIRPVVRTLTRFPPDVSLSEMAPSFARDLMAIIEGVKPGVSGDRSGEPQEAMYLILWRLLKDTSQTSGDPSGDGRGP